MSLTCRQWRHHRLTLGWRQQPAADYVRHRYLSEPEARLATHVELSNLHLLGFLVTSVDMMEDGTPCTHVDNVLPTISPYRSQHIMAQVSAKVMAFR